MLSIEIECEILKQILNKENIKLLSIKNIKDDFFMAISYNEDIFYFHFNNGKISFNNYQNNPAIQLKNGTEIYMVNNKIHRENNKPAIFFDKNFEMYFKYGKLHRENDKPAVIVDFCASFPFTFYYGDVGFENTDMGGYRLWFKNNKIHRINKHAFISNINEENNAYFLNNEEFTSEDEFKKACLQYVVEEF